MANILFIAYDYPPILSPESIQVQRRALSLANSCNNIYILTSHIKPKFEFIDNTLIKKHKNIKIINTKQPLFQTALNIFYRIFDLTDRKYWWKYYALSRAKEILESFTIDIVYTHSTPLVDHLVGIELKNKYQCIKWIAHFSDPWSLNPYKKYKFKWQLRLNQKYEKKVLQACDILTVTSEKTKELFVNNFKYAQSKTYVLPHTFDKSLFKTKKVINDKKIVVHTGNIYGLRTIRYFIEALSEIDLRNIEFHFYGKIKDSEIKLIYEYGLSHLIKVFNQISYLESLQVISNANYLMIVDAPLQNSPFFPSKLADYIGSNKPIIALTPFNSATVDILKHIENNHFIASSDNKDAIKSILMSVDNERKLVFNNQYFYDMDNVSLLKDVFEK